MNLLRTIELSCSEVICPGGWENGIDMTLVGELAKDLRAGKILPPIKVTMGHRLVAGRHRLKAHMVLGLKRVRADVIQYESPEEAEEDGLLENLRRRVLPPEEHDKALVRLWEIIRGRLTQEPRQMSDAPQSVPAPVAEPTKNAVDVAVAEKASVHPRTVERARAREKQRNDYPKKEGTVGAAAGQEPVTAAPAGPATAAQAEDAFLVEHGRKRRARALKRMAELLRKVEECLPDLAGMDSIWRNRIDVMFGGVKEAVWEASVAEGRGDSPGAGAEPETTGPAADVPPSPEVAPNKQGRTGGSIPPTGANSLQMQTGEEVAVASAASDEPGEAKGGDAPPGEPASRPKTARASASREPVVSKKRLRIEGPDGKPLDPDED